MNRNYKKNSSNSKLPMGVIIMIIFALIGIAPILVPLVFIALIAYIIAKNMKSNDSQGSSKKHVNKVVVEKKNIHSTDIADIKDKQVQTIKPESQKRLETLKYLYDNGFMEKDEFEEKRKKIV